MTLEVFFWVPKGIVPSLFKVTTGNYSYTIRIGRSKLLLEDQQLLMILSFEWVLKVKNVGVYVQQIQDRRVHGIGAAHGCVSKFYKR